MELQTACSEPYSNDGSELVCNQDIYKQLRNRANKWELTGRTPFLLEEHLSFGIPDDSTDFLYGYNNKIIDAQNMLIGYSTLDVYYNSEGEWMIQLIVYYNTNGDVVGSKINEI